ncbi:MAG: OmpA family protein [Rhodospirillaceae bacterium]
MIKKMMIAVVAAGALSACADRWDIDGAESMAPSADPYYAALQPEFVALAKAEGNEGDWEDMAFFIAKAKAAAAGGPIEPSTPDSRDLGADFAAEAASDYAALMAALPSMISTDPASAAKATAMWECWLQEAEEGWQDDDIAACKLNLTPAVPFVVYFSLGSSSLDATAMATVEEVSSSFNTTVPAQVIVVGHADTVASPAFNIKLSQRRAESVAQALAARGIASEVMTLEAYGEERLAVPTPDGTPERLNRRVEITFRM